MKPGTAFSVSEAVFKHQILPLLQNCRRTVRIKRVLKDNDIMLKQQRLFPRDIDVEFWIPLIEIVHGYSGRDRTYDNKTWLTRDL